MKKLLKKIYDFFYSLFKNRKSESYENITEEEIRDETNENEYKMKYFTINELTYSDTAKSLGLDNTPNEEETKNLKRLIEFIDGIREDWGSEIRVNSGFRGEAVNKAVGGVSTSAHRTGNAVDLYPSNGKFNDFKAFISTYLKDKAFDQCITEKNSRGSEWIHFGLYNNQGLQRKQLFNLNVK